MAEIELIGKIRILAQQQDKRAAASYKEALRDAELFWRLLNSLPENLPHKQELKNQYLEIMNLTEDEE